MSKSIKYRRITSIVIGFSVLFVILFGLYFLSRHKQNGSQVPSPISSDQTVKLELLPEEISPEAVANLYKDNKPYILVNADNPPAEILASQGIARLIYFTTTPSYRSAQKFLREDRSSKPQDISNSTRLNSQRLTGTPLDWHRLKLNFLVDPYPTAPQMISVNKLAEAIKDGVDLQFIDLRPIDPLGDNTSPFQGALRLMPDEVAKNLEKISKEKWTVLIGFNNHATQLIATELFNKGLLLTVVLDGGYPAWVNATNR